MWRLLSVYLVLNLCWWCLWDRVQRHRFIITLLDSLMIFIFTLRLALTIVTFLIESKFVKERLLALRGCCKGNWWIAITINICSSYQNRLFSCLLIVGCFLVRLWVLLFATVWRSGDILTAQNANWILWWLIKLYARLLLRTMLLCPWMPIYPGSVSLLKEDILCRVTGQGLGLLAG